MRKIKIRLETEAETVNEARQLIASHFGCTIGELIYKVIEVSPHTETVQVRYADKTATMVVPTWSRID